MTHSANTKLKFSAAGAHVVKHFESCLKPVGKGKFTAYYCPANVLTIGWGHTNHHGRKFLKGSIWSQAECDREFLADMKLFENAVKKHVKVQLSLRQYDALVSFTYNCGEGALRKSTLLAKINRGDFKGAANEFAKWNRGGGRVLKGLVRRRAAEANVFAGRREPLYVEIKDLAPETMPDEDDLQAHKVESTIDDATVAGTRGLQHALNLLLKLDPPLKEDGIEGPKTIEAIRQFQRRYKLEVTGDCDDLTSAAIDHAMAEAASV